MPLALAMCPGVRAADLAVTGLSMPAGSTANVVVSGSILGESAAGVTILLEITADVGATGVVTFTAAPPVDIVQIGDPWPGAGNFSAFDTNAPALSPILNGSVDDNGSGTPSAVTFTGDLSSFPVIASADASGTWTVSLITSAGTSQWNNGGGGVAGALTGGTITICPSCCNSNADCSDADVCTDDVCNLSTGLCEFPFNTAPCNDGNACTTVGACSAGACVGASAVDCTGLNDACNIGVCNTGTGVCSPQPTNEGGVCTDGDVCTIGDLCSTGTCAGTAVDCTSLDGQCTVGVCNVATGLCQANPINEGGVCTDGNLCTVGDLCSTGTCAGVPTDCSSLDSACTPGVCNGLTGVCEAQSANNGGACDDADPCTASDLCSAGACAGSPIVGCINCPPLANCFDGDSCTDDICVAGVCQNPANGNCTPTLTLNADAVCYDLGLNNIVTVSVDMTGMNGLPVVAGQFFLEYDATKLLFLDAVPGDAPFNIELSQTNSPIGTLDYAVVADFGGMGTTADTTMARITFQTLVECTPFVRFRAHTPATNVGTFGSPTPILPTLVDMVAVSIDQTAPVISPQGNINVDADAGGCTAVVSWPAPTATGHCDGAVPVTCASSPTAGHVSGDAFPNGTTTITCTAVDSCGNNATDLVFNVNVSASNIMRVDVALQGLDPAPVDRCMTFEVWNCATGLPTQVTQVLTFTHGLASGVAVPVACTPGPYTCATARDTLHTLRSTALDFAVNLREYSATFTSLGGNVCAGGNLNDDAFVDIVDLAVFTAQFLSTVVANTSCTTPFPHADFNGDGLVDTGDFTFIKANFGLANQPNCCGAPSPEFGGTRQNRPRTRISIRELKAMWLGQLQVADLTGDGWVDELDMDAFVGGQLPGTPGGNPLRTDKGAPKRSASDGR